MTRKLSHIVIIITLAALSACGTVNGIGKDISTAGKAISQSTS